MILYLCICVFMHVCLYVCLWVELRFWQCTRNITIRYLVIPYTIGIQAMLFPSGAQVFIILYEYPKSFKT